MYINNIVYKIEHMSAVGNYRIFIAIGLTDKILINLSLRNLMHERTKESCNLNKEFLSNHIYHNVGCWTW